MIPLSRKRTKTAVHKKFHGQSQRDLLITVMKAKRDKAKANDDKKVKFDSGKWKVTKKQLQAETEGKCAYCEATTTESMHGDVEHYRPKSHYWWLAYVYDNYLASCQLCNQKFKKAFFELINPDGQMQGPVIDATTTDEQIVEMAETAIPDPLDAAEVASFDAAHDVERPKIVNPYVDDPTDYFAWEVSRSGSVDLVARSDNPDAAPIVDACERLLGLNRAELRERRFQVFSKYEFFAMVAGNDTLPEDLRQRATEQIDKDFAAPNQPYSGMIRFFEQQRKAAA